MASCALLQGGRVLHLESSGVRTHSQSILPMVQQLLQQAGIALKDCAAIAYGAGPGTFTGVRTACGIAQGLAFGAALPVLPVITLAAMALACRQQCGAADVVAVLDARMGEVYWAQYRFAADPAPLTLVPPTLSAPAGVHPQGSAASGFKFCGNGLAAHAAVFDGLAAHPGIMPHAVQIGQLARIAFAAGAAVPARDAQPVYLRNKIAFTSDERRAILAAKAAAEAAEAAS